jgi:M6 family metalloprotease-like protein
VLKNLVIPMRFKDHGDRSVPRKNKLSTLMNHVGPHDLCPTGSVRDHYLVSSYGALELDSTVAAWVTLSEDEYYYGDARWWNIEEGIVEALEAVQAAGVNFKDYDVDGDGKIDGITFLHSGYGAEFGSVDCYGQEYQNRVWSHKAAIDGWTSEDGVTVTTYHISPAVWSTCGVEIGRIGVIAHETGHFLGFPDYYDYGSGQGLGAFELMAYSWGFDGSQHYPPIMSARLREEIGWLEPTVVATVEGEEEYELQPAATHDEAYKITAGFPAGEYLLIENRQAISFDGTMDASGLAIYHVDENKCSFYDGICEQGAAYGGYPGHSNWPAQHYYVALQPVDGEYGLEKGWIPGASNCLFRAGDSLVPGGDSPNTDAYSKGYFETTGLTIKDIAADGTTMKFTLSRQIPATPERTGAHTRSVVLAPCLAAVGGGDCEYSAG